MTTKTITVEKTFGDRTVSKNGTCVQAESAEDILTLLQEDQNSVKGEDETDTEFARRKNRVISFFNYASDLKARASITNQINSENVDPTKALDKAVQDFMKYRASMGKPVTEDQARALLSA